MSLRDSAWLLESSYEALSDQRNHFRPGSMIALVQRISRASVSVKNDPSRTNSVGLGLIVLLGVGEDDTDVDLKKLATKLAKLRVFADEASKMNLDIISAKGELLLVSQFTLLADVSGGNRPSFIKAAEPKLARELYKQLAQNLTTAGIPVKTGFFGESMEIKATIDGPVTIYLDSKKL